jgi:DNA-binding transcriptional regulator YiaG
MCHDCLTLHLTRTSSDGRPGSELMPPYPYHRAASEAVLLRPSLRCYNPEDSCLVTVGTGFCDHQYQFHNWPSHHSHSGLEMTETKTSSVPANSSTDVVTQRHPAIIAGYVLKLARESVGLTQEGLASHLYADPHTVHSWETGRRPLTATHADTFISLQHKLARLGVSSLLLNSLRTALEADYVLGYILTSNLDDTQRIIDHPLGVSLLSSSLSGMLAWPLIGSTPSELRQVGRISRRGPVSANPTLPATDRQRFFHQLRLDVERSLPLREKTAQHAVLVHQACFRAAWDTSPLTGQWLHDMWRSELAVGRLDHWSPRWLTVRSLAIARARQGDIESLDQFVSMGHSSELCEVANLNYLAYWVGEISPSQTDNDFMISTCLLQSWTGVKLLGHLLTKMNVDDPDLVLNVHSVHMLLKKPITAHILEANPDLYISLRQKLHALMDSRNFLTSHVCQEIQQALLELKHIPSPLFSTARRR